MAEPTAMGMGLSTGLTATATGAIGTATAGARWSAPTASPFQGTGTDHVSSWMAGDDLCGGRGPAGVAADCHGSGGNFPSVPYLPPVRSGRDTGPFLPFGRASRSP